MEQAINNILTYIRDRWRDRDRDERVRDISITLGAITGIVAMFFAPACFILFGILVGFSSTAVYMILIYAALVLGEITYYISKVAKGDTKYRNR